LRAHMTEKAVLGSRFSVLSENLSVWDFAEN
jgi:hypothetical protein